MEWKVERSWAKAPRLTISGMHLPAATAQFIQYEIRSLEARRDQARARERPDSPAGSAVL
jgi:hypothetical protein